MDDHSLKIIMTPRAMIMPILISKTRILRLTDKNRLRLTPRMAQPKAELIPLRKNTMEIIKDEVHI